MKQSKRLTREQKILLTETGYDHTKYFLQRDLPNCVVVVEKTTGKTVVVEKFVR